jgi:diguanylate cyclase (GGDEF)-like protein
MSDSQKNRIYWLPAILFVCLFLLFSAAGAYLHSEDQNVRLQKAASVAAQTKAYMETFSVERKHALTNLLKSWPSFEPNIEDWFNVQAQQLTTMQKGYSSLVHANQDKVITWVYSPPNQLARNRLTPGFVGLPLDSVGMEIKEEENEFASKIIEETTRVDIVQYLVVGRAVSPQEQEHGYLVASYNLNNILYALLGDLLADADGQKNQFNVALMEGDKVLLASGNIDLEDSTVITEPVDFIFRTWQLSVQTKPENAALGLVVVLVGSIMSMLICLFLHKQLKGSEALNASQRRFRTASNASLDALLIYTPQNNDFKLIEFNHYAQALFGKNSLLVNTRTLSTQLSAIGQADLFSVVKKVHESGIPHEEYIDVSTKSVNADWVKIQMVRAGHDIALTIRDVSARFKAQVALKESEEKYRRLIDGLHRHFVYSKNIDHEFQYVSAGVDDIFNMSAERFCEYEASMRHLLSERAERQRAAVSTGKTAKPYTIEYLSAEAGTYVIEYTDTCVFNPEGNLVAIEGIARDVTQERELQKKVTFQAEHDQLTGLYNRYAFDQQLKKLLNEVNHRGDKAVMCFIDMDRFKLVNDTCGHPAGDRLLKEIAQLFSQHVSEDDTLARIGGDEFCIIYRRKTIDKVTPILDALLQDISAYRFVFDDKVFFVGASIGVIEIDHAHNDAAELIKAADNACYQAKYEGRNRYHVFEASESDREISQAENDALGWLQKAITETGFELYCQLIEPLNRTTDNVQYEVLVRMLNPQGELVSPGLFIPLAERHGLMNKLDCWVVDNALSKLEKAPAHVEKLEKVALNLSGTTLGDDNMLEFLVKRVAMSSIPTHKICFEITETEAVTNLSTAKHFIQTLRDLGCRFALDDFGAGMSSFTYLKHLDVDYVKIDGSFVRNMTTDNIDFATVKAINSIAHSMGKETVAEFVVDAETSELLKTLRVDYGQGFGLGKPVPLHDVLTDADKLRVI